MPGTLAGMSWFLVRFVSPDSAPEQTAATHGAEEGDCQRMPSPCGRGHLRLPPPAQPFLGRGRCLSCPSGPAPPRVLSGSYKIFSFCLRSPVLPVPPTPATLLQHVLTRPPDPGSGFHTPPVTLGLVFGWPHACFLHWLRSPDSLDGDPCHPRPEHLDCGHVEVGG